MRYLIVANCDDDYYAVDKYVMESDFVRLRILPKHTIISPGTVVDVDIIDKDDNLLIANKILRVIPEGYVD